MTAMSDAQRKINGSGRKHPLLSIIAGAGSSRSAERVSSSRQRSVPAGLAKTTIGVGMNLGSQPGIRLDEHDGLHKVFARAVFEDGISFSLAADVGIVAILERGGESWGCSISTWTGSAPGCGSAKRRTSICGEACIRR
jgi:hypothetical protein